MIERITEKRLVEQEVTVGGLCTCDICGKTIYEINDTFPIKLTKRTRHDEYWHLITGHNDWGNDSCESVETLDLCSKECCIKALDNYLYEYSGTRNTGYFELRHENSES